VTAVELRTLYVAAAAFRQWRHLPLAGRGANTNLWDAGALGLYATAGFPLLCYSTGVTPSELDTWFAYVPHFAFLLWRYSRKRSLFSVVSFNTHTAARRCAFCLVCRVFCCSGFFGTLSDITWASDAHMRHFRMQQRLPEPSRSRHGQARNAPTTGGERAHSTPRASTQSCYLPTHTRAWEERAAAPHAVCVPAASGTITYGHRGGAHALTFLYAVVAAASAIPPAAYLTAHRTYRAAFLALYLLWAPNDYPARSYGPGGMMVHDISFPGKCSIPPIQT